MSPTVLFITPGFTADEQDHNCLPTLQLYALALQRQGARVFIISLDYPFSNQPYRWRGIPVYPCGGKNRRWLKPLVVWRAWRYGRRLLRAHPEAVVHSFWLNWPCLTAALLARLYRRRHINTLMGQDALPANRHWFWLLHRRWVDSSVVLSTYHREVLAKHSGHTVRHVIPWGIEPSEFAQVPDPSRSVDIIGVGSLIPLKAWSEWLEVLAMVAARLPGLRATLIGSGPEMERLSTLCHTLGLTKQVRFTGELSRPEVLQLLGRSRVLLHCAGYESQGYVLLEALAAGCAVVSKPVGIAPQIAVAATEREQLAEAVCTALEGERHAAFPYRMEETVCAYLALYQASGYSDKIICLSPSSG